MSVKIALDVDGVLADFSAGMIPLLSKQMGDRLTWADPYDFPERWNWSDLGATPTDVGAVWGQIRHTEGFWLGLPALAGLRQLYAALYRGDLLGRDLLFLTSRVEPVSGDSAHIQTERWLTKMLGLDKPFVWVVPNAYAKVKALETAEIDWLLDDFAPTVEMARHVCKGAYMLRQPWNRADELAYSIRSVDSVQEFLKVVTK